MANKRKSLSSDLVAFDAEHIGNEERVSTDKDIVNRPSHYTKFEVEPIEFIMINSLEFWRGNIVKYTLRAGSKLYEGRTAEQSEVIDLKKVMRYAEMRINMIEGRKAVDSDNF